MTTWSSTCVVSDGNLSVCSSAPRRGGGGRSVVVFDRCAFARAPSRSRCSCSFRRSPIVPSAAARYLHAAIPSADRVTRSPRAIARRRRESLQPPSPANRQNGRRGAPLLLQRSDLCSARELHFVTEVAGIADPLLEPVERLVCCILTRLPIDEIIFESRSRCANASSVTLRSSRRSASSRAGRAEVANQVFVRVSAHTPLLR